MPSWLITALAFIGPLTSVAAGIEHLATAIAAELRSADDVVDKVDKVAEDVAAAAPDIAHALIANTPHEAAAGAAAAG